MPLLLRPADHQVDAGGVDAGMTQHIRKAHDVPAGAVKCRGEQVPQIMREHLGRFHPRRLAQPLKFVPYLPTRDRPSAFGEKDLTGGGFLLFGVLHQLVAQLGGQQDRADLALEGDGGPSCPRRLHGDIPQLGHADAGGAQGLHDEGEAFLPAFPRGGEQAVVLLLRQLLGAVPEDLPLDLQKFHLDVPRHKAAEAVHRRQHRIDRARRIAAVAQVVFPSRGGLLRYDAPVQPAGKRRQITAIFRDRSRRPLVRQKGQAVGVDALCCDDVVHVDTSWMWYQQFTPV